MDDSLNNLYISPPLSPTWTAFTSPVAELLVDPEDLLVQCRIPDTRTMVYTSNVLHMSQTFPPLGLHSEIPRSQPDSTPSTGA